MGCSEINTEISSALKKFTKKDRKKYPDFDQNERTPVAFAHNITQNTTVLLVTLELVKLTGELSPENLALLFDTTLELREDVKSLKELLEANNIMD